MVGGDRETINHDNSIWETSTCEYLSVYLQIKTVGIPGYYQLSTLWRKHDSKITFYFKLTIDKK